LLFVWLRALTPHAVHHFPSSAHRRPRRKVEREMPEIVRWA
jgi:hypothetical protein